MKNRDGPFLFQGKEVFSLSQIGDRFPPPGEALVRCGFGEFENGAFFGCETGRNGKKKGYPK